MNLFRNAIIAALAMGLGGCWGGEPSETNMLDALKRNEKFRFVFAMHAGAAGQRNVDQAVQDALKRAVLKKSGCAQAQGSPGYVCDFQIGTREPSGTVNYGGLAKARFFLAGSEWQVEI